MRATRPGNGRAVKNLNRKNPLDPLPLPA